MSDVQAGAMNGARSSRRVALVTGANRGIGREIARQLAKQDVVAVIGSRDMAKGRAVAAEFASEGLETPVIALDVDDINSASAAVEEIHGRYGRLDILVNNAAVLMDAGGFTGSLFLVTPEVGTATFRTNVLGPLHMIQAAAPVMREARYGRIVNLSSGAGQLHEMSVGFPTYRMSKSALNALTRIAAAELSAHNIKVNAMCPGWVRTDMGGPNATRTAEEAADTALWLAALPDTGPTGGFFRNRKPIPW